MFKMMADIKEHYIDYKIIDQDDDTIVNGSIKWDGCSNWNYSTDDVMIHFCSEGEMKSFHETMQSCYAHARRYYGQEFDA